jgi:hypothetical protein
MDNDDAKHLLLDIQRRVLTDFPYEDTILDARYA